MKQISIDEAIQHLHNYFETLDACIKDAFQEYCEEYADDPSISPISRSILIRDKIIRNIQSRFKECINLKHYKKGLTFYLIIGEDPQFVFRFKKFDKYFRTKNHPTQQALKFSQQEPPFPGLLPRTINLNAGYLPNDFWTKSERFITCPMGEKSINWILNLEFKVQNIVSEGKNNENKQISDTSSRSKNLKLKEDLKHSRRENNG